MEYLHIYLGTKYREKNDDFFAHYFILLTAQTI